MYSKIAISAFRRVSHDAARSVLLDRFEEGFNCRVVIAISLAAH